MNNARKALAELQQDFRDKLSPRATSTLAIRTSPTVGIGKELNVHGALLDLVEDHRTALEQSLTYRR